MTDYIQDFRTHLERLGYSPGSQRMLPDCVREFMQFTGGLPSDEVTPAHITAYHGYLQERPKRRGQGGLSEMMIHHHVYSLRVFFDYLQHSGAITLHPLSGLVFAPPSHSAREVLSPEDVRLLFGAARNLTDLAVLHLCYSCGLRRSEAVALSLRDVHFRDLLLYVRRGKGAKRRVIPLTPRVGEALRCYCYQERPERLGTAATDAFLVNRRGRAMQGDTLGLTLKALLAQAGICRPLTLHGLRHSIATHLLAEGLSLYFVRDFLGHLHLETTQLYTHIPTGIK
jgi:integrase/recombinase XerD